MIRTSPARTVSPNAARWVARCASADRVADERERVVDGTGLVARRADRGAQLVAGAAGDAARAEHDVAVEDVAREDVLDVAVAEVDELDRGAETADRGGDGRRGPPRRHVGGDVDRDLRLRRRLAPVADRDLAAGLEQPAVGEEADQRRVVPCFSIAAGVPRPSFQPIGRAPSSRERRRRSSWRSIPRRTRGSSCRAVICTASWRSLHPSDAPSYLTEHMFDRPEEPQAAWTSART